MFLQWLIWHSVEHDTDILQTAFAKTCSRQNFCNLITTLIEITISLSMGVMSNKNQAIR